MNSYIILKSIVKVLAFERVNFWVAEPTTNFGVSFTPHVIKYLCTYYIECYVYRTTYACACKLYYMEIEKYGNITIKI